MRARGLSSAECFVNVSFLDHERERPDESRLSCGALKKDSFHNLRAPPASAAGEAASRRDTGDRSGAGYHGASRATNSL